MRYDRCPLGLGLLLMGIGVFIGGILPYLFVKWLLGLALILIGIVLLQQCC